MTFSLFSRKKLEEKEKKIALLLSDLTSLEKYIEDLLNFFPLPICFISPLGVVLEINPAFEKVSGFPSEEIIGESIEKLFDAKEIAAISTETIAKGTVAGREMELRKKNGQPLIVRVFTRTRTDENAQITGYFLGLFDLSEIKQSEQELKKVQTALLSMLEDTEEARKKAEEEKGKTQAIITNFTDGLLFFDKNCNLVLINPKAENFFGIGKKDFIGQPSAEMTNSPGLKKLINFLGPKMKSVSRQEFTLVKDVILEVSVILMKDSESSLGNLIILHDVSREKMVEKLKTEFVSLAAHQLRAPLSAIKWSLRMFLDGDLGSVKKEQKGIIEKAYEANERMVILVNDLLNVARIEEGRYAIETVPVDLVKICQSAIDFAKDSFKKKSIDFEFRQPEKPIMVSADKEKLILVVQNLLDNAMKYTKKHGQVSFALKETPKTVIVEVKDSGIGIAKDEQKRVFSKFFRTKEAVLTEPTGTGLGLYMAKNIIESHGGKIGFKSQLGKGATFYFSLEKRK